MGKRSERFTAVELADDDKVPVLRAYLKRWKFEVGVFFDGVGPDSSDEELRGAAPKHPVFRLARVPVTSAPPATRARHIAACPAVSLPRLMSAERAPIGVIGTGYVGLVTAAGFAELGNEVWCVDIDAEKIERLRRGEVPIYEPGLEAAAGAQPGSTALLHRPGEALEHARLLFVAVGTPPTYSGDADLSAVHAVVDAIPASDGHALVMKSTVPCGTGAAIRRGFGERGKDGLRYVSCPSS